MEDQKTLEHFVKYFGDKFYNYLIILFTMKDDLDYEGVELMDKLKTVSDELKALITKCGGRVIAFNNRLKGEQQNAQVIELLSMILKNIKSNKVEYYTYDMYIEAEIQLIKREKEMMIKAKWECHKEFIKIEKRLLFQIEKENETHRQCKGLWMKTLGEEKEVIYVRNAEDEVKLQQKLRTDLEIFRSKIEIADRKLKMIQETIEEMHNRILESTEKEHLNTLRTEGEDFLTMAVNTAKSWLPW